MKIKEIIQKLNDLPVVNIQSFCRCFGSLETEDTGKVSKSGRGDYIRLEDVVALLKEIEK